MPSQPIYESIVVIMEAAFVIYCVPYETRWVEMGFWVLMVSWLTDWILFKKKKKKHHYHELSHEMQVILGAIPVDFTKYWIQRFPYLVSHSYHALEKHSYENAFKLYYDSSFRYAKPEYFHRETDDCVWPDKLGKKLGDSPRRITKDFRPRNNDRRLSQDATAADGKSLNDNVYKSGNKRGSYNFHKNVDGDSTLTLRKNNWRKPNNIGQDVNVTWTMTGNDE